MKFIAYLFIYSLLSACTTEQWYASGQNWQRNQCNTLADYDAQTRCTNKADVSYEAYKQELK